MATTADIAEAVDVIVTDTGDTAVTGIVAAMFTVRVPAAIATGAGETAIVYADVTVTGTVTSSRCEFVI